MLYSRSNKNKLVPVMLSSVNDKSITLPDGRSVSVIHPKGNGPKQNTMRSNSAPVMLSSISNSNKTAATFKLSSKFPRVKVCAPHSKDSTLRKFRRRQSCNYKPHVTYGITHSGKRRVHLGKIQHPRNPKTYSGVPGWFLMAVFTARCDPNLATYLRFSVNRDLNRLVGFINSGQVKSSKHAHNKPSVKERKNGNQIKRLSDKKSLLDQACGNRCTSSASLSSLTEFTGDKQGQLKMSNSSPALLPHVIRHIEGPMTVVELS